MSDDFIELDKTPSALEESSVFMTSDELRRDQLHRIVVDDAAQRRSQRKLAFVVGIVVLLFMAALLFCVILNFSYAIFGGGVRFTSVPSPVFIALYLAPVTSISAITITILLGAFRRFKDADEAQVATMAQKAVDATTGG